MLQELDRNKAYVLGFFHADGCYGINRKKYYVKGEERVAEQAFFHIGTTDFEVIDFISKVLGIHYIVSEDHRKDSYKTYYRINSHNKEITADLAYHGYREKKTLGLSHFPIINDEFIPDFLRGFFDGDGTATSGHSSFFVTEDKTEKFITEYLNKHNIIVHRYEHPRKTMTLIELRISTRSMLDFYNLLYSNGGFCLERKKKRFEEVLQGIVSTCRNAG